MLKIVVGATPGSSNRRLDLSKELRMLKSAVLYGDKVSIYSQAYYLVLSLKTIGEIGDRVSTYDKFTWTAEVFAPLFERRGVSTEELIQVRERYRELSKVKYAPTNVIKKRLQIEKSLDHLWSSYLSNIKEVIAGSGYEELERLVELDRVDVPTSGFRGPSDAKSASEEVIDAYINELVRSVNDVHTLPLLDDLSGRLIAAMIKEGKLTPNPSAAHRSSHAGLFAELFNRLPEFDKASVDELLDIRKELERPLTNFRSKLSKLSADFDSASWDEDFAFDAQRAVIEHIEPEIQEIEDAIRSNTYLAKLNTRITDKVTQEWAAVLGLAVMSNSATLMVAGAAVSAGKNVIQAKQDLEASKKEVEGKSMYFYYGVGERLSR